jgi:translation elongation factor EF-4
LSFLGIGSSSNEVPERRETKQEREARKLEKERVARIKEREKSLKEEHVDGGYLVTMGVYTGHEDFDKSIVRQLMVCMILTRF